MRKLIKIVICMTVLVLMVRYIRKRSPGTPAVPATPVAPEPVPAQMLKRMQHVSAGLAADQLRRSHAAAGRHSRHQERRGPMQRLRAHRQRRRREAFRRASDTRG